MKADLLITQERATSLEGRCDEQAEKLQRLATQVKDLQEHWVSMEEKQQELDDKLNSLRNVVDSYE